MSSSPTDARSAGRPPRRGWRTVHLLLAALLGFLLVLGTVAVLLLRYSAMQPSVRQLAQPLTAIVELIDAGDADSDAQALRTLAHQDIRRAAQPPASVKAVPVPFLDALSAYLRVQTQRRVTIEHADDDATRIWIQSARGDYIGIPLEPLRSLVARFALVIVLVAVLLAVFAAWWLARRLAAPLERLARVAARLPEPVAASEFRVAGPREVRLLGDRLADALSRIDAQRRERDLMLAGLSHDLRTPLMRLLLRIDLSDAIDDAERSALGADIHELDRRIDRFIEHARTGAEEPVVALDLAALLRAEIESSRARGRHWQVDAVDVAIVRGQPGVLARLIANLIDNAEQHGAAPWRVELARADDREPQWRLRVDNAIAPANNGQAVATAPHRGFGLALCRHIAQAHGGRLEHRSDDGQFHVELRLPIV